MQNLSGNTNEVMTGFWWTFWFFPSKLILETELIRKKLSNTNK